MQHEYKQHKKLFSTLDRDEIIETIVRMVARLIPCDRVGVGLADRERGGIIYTADFGVDALKKGPLYPLKTPPIQRWSRPAGQRSLSLRSLKDARARSLIQRWLRRF